FAGGSRAPAQMATARHRAERESETRRRLARADRYNVEQSAQAYAHGARLMAQKDAGRFRARLAQYEAADRSPDYLRQVWQAERGQVFQKLREGGQIVLHAHRIGEDGLVMYSLSSILFDR